MKVVPAMVQSGIGLDMGLRLFEKGHTYNCPERYSVGSRLNAF